ncbi:MAG TPA: hypothetical protein VKU60_20215 [Chloroflexota bacterium]|nr:hypothetical protein [Chloroflexota bacterium]
MYKDVYAPGARERVCGPARVKRTSLNLNMALVDKARRELGTKTTKETIEIALWETIAMLGREAFLRRDRQEPYDPQRVEEWEAERRRMWSRGLEGLDESCAGEPDQAG